MNVRGFGGAIVLAIVVSLVGASAAPSRDALLRPGIGVGKVRLGMSFAQVRAVLGPPARVVRRQRDRLGVDYVEYAWGVNVHWAVGLAARDAQARVVLVETTRRERTRSGVGIGSTQRALQRTLGARCRGPRRSPTPGIPAENPGYPLLRWCSLGGAGGKPVTMFSLVAECSIPDDRHTLCPRSKRTYRAYEVVIATALGLRIRHPR